MGKLHEVLATEPDVKSTAEAILNETINTFVKKPDHFKALNKHYEPVNEDGKQFADENVSMITTVTDKLQYTQKKLGRMIDLMYQKELANTHAKADLIIDGKTISTQMPATVLLNLENRFKSIKQMYLKVPTLDPSERWTKDTERKNTYVADVLEREKTNKTLKPMVMYEATKEHPAQIKEISEDVRIGMWKTTKWSGMMSPADKAETLERLDNLISSIKKARCRANNVEAESVQISEILFGYIEKGTL